MNVENLLTQTCTVTHRTPGASKDGMGDPTIESTTATYMGFMWQERRSEVTGNIDLQQGLWQLALDPSAEGNVDGGDAVTVDDVAYEFDGPPWTVQAPWGTEVSYVLATVRRTA